MIEGKIKQRGFTLVELAIVLVIIGIIIGAVLKGTEMINNSRAKRVQNDMRGLEAAIWTFYDRRGTFPGDINGDGIIDYELPSQAPTYATASDADRPWNDLKSQAILPNIPNNLLAKHTFNSYFAIGNYTVSNVDYNAIAIYNIPSFAAQMIDTSIDGTVNAAAGRVRGLNVSSWPQNPQELTHLVYYFDRTP